MVTVALQGSRNEHSQPAKSGGGADRCMTVWEAILSELGGCANTGEGGKRRSLASRPCARRTCARAKAHHSDPCIGYGRAYVQ